MKPRKPREMPGSLKYHIHPRGSNYTKCGCIRSQMPYLRDPSTEIRLRGLKYATNSYVEPLGPKYPVPTMMLRYLEPQGRCSKANLQTKKQTRLASKNLGFRLAPANPKPRLVSKPWGSMAYPVLGSLLCWGCGDFGSILGAPDFLGTPIPRSHNIIYTYIPKGPSTNMIRTLGFYIGIYYYGLGQVLII